MVDVPKNCNNRLRAIGLSVPRTCSVCGGIAVGCLVFRPDLVDCLPRDEVETEGGERATPSRRQESSDGHWLARLLDTAVSAPAQAKRGTDWQRVYDRSVEVLSLVRELRAGPQSTEKLNRLSQLLVRD